MSLETTVEEYRNDGTPTTQHASTTTSISCTCDSVVLVGEKISTSQDDLVPNMSDTIVVEHDTDNTLEQCVVDVVPDDVQVKDHKSLTHLKMFKEDVTQIKCLSDLAMAKRVNTKFTLFKNLKDESDVIVPLINGATMRVHYRDIRYIESFLWYIYDDQTGIMQQSVNCTFRRRKLICRLSEAENAILLHLISCVNCSNITLCVALNIKLHQLSALFYELVRRGETIDQNFQWRIMDNDDRNHLKGVMERVILRNAQLDTFLYYLWKQRHGRLQQLPVKKQFLTANGVTLEQRKEIEFCMEIQNEINTITRTYVKECGNDANFPLCKLAHMVYISEEAYTMSTGTLRMEVQRKIDILAVLIIEHNVRAKNKYLLLNQQYYALAMENTILAFEIMQSQLYYD